MEKYRDVSLAPFQTWRRIKSSAESLYYMLHTEGCPDVCICTHEQSSFGVAVVFCETWLDRVFCGTKTFARFVSTPALIELRQRGGEVLVDDGLPSACKPTFT